MNLFPTLTPELVRTHIQQARAATNSVTQQIQQRIHQMHSLALTPTDRLKLVMAGLVRFPRLLTHEQQEALVRRVKNTAAQRKYADRIKAERQADATR